MIQYQCGKDNVVADAFIRRPPSIHLISVVAFDSYEHDQDFHDVRIKDHENNLAPMGVIFSFRNVCMFRVCHSRIQVSKKCIDHHLWETSGDFLLHLI